METQLYTAIEYYLIGKQIVRMDRTSFGLLMGSTVKISYFINFSQEDATKSIVVWYDVIILLVYIKLENFIVEVCIKQENEKSYILMCIIFSGRLSAR